MLASSYKRVVGGWGGGFNGNALCGQSLYTIFWYLQCNLWKKLLLSEVTLGACTLIQWYCGWILQGTYNTILSTHVHTNPCWNYCSPFSASKNQSISRSSIALSLLMLEKKIIPDALFKIRWPKKAQLYVCSSVHACAYTWTHTCVLAVHFSLQGNCKQVALYTELTPFSLMIFKYFSSEFKPLHSLHSCQSKRNAAVQMPGVLYHSMATSMEPTAERHRRCKMLWCPLFSVCNRQTEHRESKQLHCVLLMHKGSDENEKRTYA